MALRAAAAFFLGCSMTVAATFTTVHDFNQINPQFSGPIAINLLGAPYGAPLFLGTDGNFYGTSSAGKNGGGLIIKLTPSGVVTALYAFGLRDSNGFYDGTTGTTSSALLRGSDGSVYGTAGNGANNNGIVFRITPSGSLDTLHAFSALSGGPPSGTNADGAGPNSGLILGADGNYYGMTGSGGANGTGTVFRIDAATHAFQPLYSLLYGSYPAGLVSGTDTYLYFFGYASSSATTPTVFKINSTTASVTPVYTFAASDGRPSTILTKATDGNLYGNGATNGTPGIFRLTPTGSFLRMHSFTSAEGTYFLSPLVSGTDKFLYGSAYIGGTHGLGTVFKFDSTTGALTVLHQFNSLNSDNTNSDGAYPGSLTFGSDGWLYGTTSGGGGGAVGTMFKLNPSSASDTLTTVCTFAYALSPNINTDGAAPFGLVQGSDGVYGTTDAGGTSGTGTFFQISPAGSFTSLYSFSSRSGSGSVRPNSDGAFPRGLVLGSGQDLFADPENGGPNGDGAIVQFNTSTKLLTRRYAFTDDLNSPSGMLGVGGGTFYGTTGSHIYRFDSSTGNVTPLFAFDPVNQDSNLRINVSGTGAQGLVSGDANSLYGLAIQGGPNATGTVYRFDLSANNVTLLHSFGAINDSSGKQTDSPSVGDINSDGAKPFAVVKASDGNLYGTAAGGPNGAGLVFMIRLSDNAFVPVHVFSQLSSRYSGQNSDGAGPVSLIQGTDGNLYGTTSQGGFGSSGTLYRMALNGSNFTVLHSFTATALDDSNTDGRYAYGLIEGVDGNLYGTTIFGGSRGWGTVFRSAKAGDANYSSWKQAHFGANAGNELIAGDLADPDRDSISNVMEYALGLDPNVSSQSGLPTASIVNGYLTFKYRHLINPSGTGYEVDVSSDLVTWDKSGSQVETVGSPVPTGDGITETVTVRLKVPINSSLRSFLQLRVTPP